MKYKKLINILISFLFSVSIYFLFNKTSIISICSFLVGYLSFNLVNKNNKLPYIFSFILVIIYLIGYSLYYYLTYDYFLNDYKHIIVLIISIISLTIIIGNYLSYILDCIINTDLYEKYDKKFNSFIVWLSIIICWIPAYLAYYPGIYAYDIRMQSSQLFLARTYNFSHLSKYHPPLHTFIWGLCGDIGKLLHISNLTVYCSLQMILVALVTTYILKFLYRQNVKKSILIISYIFLVINPLMPLFALVTTKDIYFGMCLVVVIISLYEFIKDELSFINSPKKYLKLSIFITLSCLLRNNAVYAFLILTLVCLIVYRKKIFPVFIIFVCPIILFYVINNPIYHFIGITEGNKRETLSVPMQQIAYTTIKHEKEINKYTLNNINRFLEIDMIKNRYNLRFADTIKINFDTFNYSNDKSGFWHLWFTLLKKYPKDYINAFLELNIPYWFIDANPIDEYANRPYLEDGILMDGETLRYEVKDGKQDYTLMAPSKFAKAYNYYHGFATYRYIEKVPLIKLVFSLAFPFVLMLFTAFVLIYKKDYKYLIIILLPFMYLMTFLLGPVSNLRYIYPIILLYPIFIYLIIKSKQQH